MLLGALFIKVLTDIKINTFMEYQGFCGKNKCYAVVSLLGVLKARISDVGAGGLDESNDFSPLPPKLNRI